jgi:hypothetical protein
MSQNAAGNARNDGPGSAGLSGQKYEKAAGFRTGIAVKNVNPHGLQSDWSAANKGVIS